jgi:hypothetical protein
MVRFRKDELKFYKSSLPKELKRLYKDNPNDREYITKFLDTYTYNYITKKWMKRGLLG